MYCANNNINAEKMTALVNSLPDRNGKSLPGEISAKQGEVTDTHISNALSKNWEFKVVSME